MASLVARPNGHFWIQITVGPVRKTIRLGAMPRKAAEVFRGRIEALNSCRLAGITPDEATSAWVRALSPEMSLRLQACGLLERRAAHTLGEFLVYVFDKLDVKGSTRVSYLNVKRNLLDFFGESKPISQITAGDAEEFLTYLKKNLAAATAAGRARRAKQFFNAAVKKRWLIENPFAGLRCGSQVNESRQEFVSKEHIEAVMAELPNNTYRLILALARYGGCRVPSEPLALKWSDVDWQKGVITLDAPKTGTRQFPIFRELRPYLEAQWDEAGESPWVISKHRATCQAMSSIVVRAIGRAGVPLWGKLFQNLRSTRETELLEQFPLHCVCKWLGNSPRIAAKHYLQVTKEHIERATGARNGVAPGEATEVQQHQHGSAS